MAIVAHMYVGGTLEITTAFNILKLLKYYIHNILIFLNVIHFMY